MSVGEMPLISIIVPCYNYGHFLPDALESVLAQDFDSWECIIVDDGSTDDTAVVAAEFAAKDQRIHYIHQPNSGLSEARNAGLRKARGAFIQILDADDGIAPQKLGVQLAYLNQHPDAAMVYGDPQFFSESMNEITTERIDDLKKNRHLRKSACGSELMHMLVHENFIETSGPLIRRRVFDTIGMFDASFRSYEDWQFWFRAAKAGFCLHYAPLRGTESWVRFGHPSMMRQLKQMNMSAFQFRRYMQSSLTGYWSVYNRYRIIRLWIRKLWLSIQR
jgi:glycosyltransferase involved in cell wall biosynthesis